jgi:hypothetical protein
MVEPLVRVLITEKDMSGSSAVGLCVAHRASLLSRSTCDRMDMKRRGSDRRCRMRTGLARSAGG